MLPAESSPAPLSLNKDRLKTLINKSPGRWYPMKGPGMKEMVPSKPFRWHSGLFDKCVLSQNPHDCSKHPKHSRMPGAASPEPQSLCVLNFLDKFS